MFDEMLKELGVVSAIITCMVESAVDILEGRKFICWGKGNNPFHAFVSSDINN